MVAAVLLRQTAPTVMEVSIGGVASMAAIQGSVTLPSGWTATCAVVAQPSKQAVCAMVNGEFRYIVYGLNRDSLVSGPILIIYTVPSASGRVSLGEHLGASPEGMAVPVASSGSISISVSPTSPVTCCPFF